MKTIKYIYQRSIFDIMKRGQVAFEYMVLIGALLVVLIPLFHYVGYYSSQNIKIDKLDDAVQTIGRSADALYALGPGNRDFVWITLPGSIRGTDISNNEILITGFVYGGPSDFHYTTIGNLNGSLPNERGTYKIKLEVLDNGVVQIEKS
jgi:uncharacterized protein (UPF0333 family)